MAMSNATPEERSAWEDRIDVLEEALSHLEEALIILDQSFATDETVILEDLIDTLSMEKYRLESYFHCEDPDRKSVV